jgi:type I restriction enzyme S subunit
MSFPRYPAYKPSGVEWLGDVPGHWDLRRLGYYFGERREKVSDLDYQPLSVTKDGIVPQLETAAKTDDGDNRKRVCRGDFVINSRSDRKGSAGLSDLDGSVSLISTVLKPKESVHGAFIHHLLRSVPFQEEFYRFGKGIVADLWSTNYTAMAGITLAIPSYGEQMSIATFLDHETAKIDALIAEQQHLIELLQEKRQAVISHAVTKGLNPDAPMKDSGVEWLGEVPAHWQVTRLKYMTTPASGIQIGPFGGMLVNLQEQETGFKLYGQENIISGDLTLVQRWLSRDHFMSLSGYHVCDGDILLTRKGSLGNAMLVKDLPHPGAIDSDTVRVRVLEELVDPSLLVLLLHQAEYIKEQLSRQKRGAILPGLNTGVIANLSILLPPFLEQASILRCVHACLDGFLAQLDNCEKIILLLQERRSALISAAVTGQIDVRGLSPEADAA